MLTPLPPTPLPLVCPGARVPDITWVPVLPFKIVPIPVRVQ